METTTSRKASGATHDELIAGLDELLAALREAGVSVSASTRFHQYRPVLLKLREKSMSPGDRAFWNLAHHAVNETRQLLAIAAHLRSKAGPDWSKHVRSVTR